MLEIPLNGKNDSSDFEQIIELEGKSYIMRLTFNVRNESWRINLSCDIDVLNGVVLVENYPLFGRYKASFDCLEGDLLLIRKTKTTTPINYDNFGVDYGLFYFTSAEVEEFKITNGLK